MAIGDYVRQTYVNGTTPAINDTNLNNNEAKTLELDEKLFIRSDEFGWMPANETWTYASATSFNISGDKTSKYQKGDKIQLTANSIVLYAYIITVTYGAPNTTVTIIGDALTNHVISNNYYSKTSNPQEFSQIFDWVPTRTWTTGTPATNVISTFRYMIIGGLCFFNDYYHADDGNGATNCTITLPVAPKNNASYINPGCIQILAGSNVQPDIKAYINDTGSFIRFLNFSTCTDNQALDLYVTGSYEI